MFFIGLGVMLVMSMIFLLPVFVELSTTIAASSSNGLHARRTFALESRSFRRQLKKQADEKTRQIDTGKEDKHNGPPSSFSGSVIEVAWDASGKRLATASDDGIARVFDVATGREIQKFQHGGTILSLAWDKEGTRLATGSSDGIARVFDVASGREIQKFNHSRPIQKKSRRRCRAGRNDCAFTTETGSAIDCKIEQSSRRMYAKWIPPNASVLEIGARYGQTTCALADRLHEKGRLTSVEADPRVWEALEGNLARKKCIFQNFHLVKGVVGRQSMIVQGTRYGTHTLPLSWQPSDNQSKHEQNLTRKKQNLTSPAHPLETLPDSFDTLAIDCEGCFATFLIENSELLRTLKMIIVESHTDQSDKEEKEVKKLVNSGKWKLADSKRRQRVLCSSSSPCSPEDATCG